MAEGRREAPTAYYDIDDILTEAERVPVTFNVAAADMGWMDDQNDDESGQLPAGSRVMIPWFLATPLAQQSMVLLDVPPTLLPATRERLLADLGSSEGRVVNLSNHPFFFEFAIKYANTVRGEPEVGATVCKLMNSLYQDIVRHTPNKAANNNVDFVARLSNMERRLYESKCSGILQHQKLMSGACTRLLLSPTLACLPSFHPSYAAAQAKAARLLAQQQAAAATPQALRNITNQAGANAAAGRRGDGGGAASASAPKASAAGGSAFGAGPTSTSTLAHLTAANAANLPLASHQKRKYGFGATQERQAAAAQADAALHLQAQQRAQQQQREQANEGRGGGAAQRKRRLTQNQ